MVNDEIKKQLHDYIDMIDDKSQLQILHETAEVYATKKQPDILDFLSPEQLKRLERSIRQADEGKLTSHEDVINLSKEWLTR